MSLPRTLLCFACVSIVVAPSPLRADETCQRCHAQLVEPRLRTPAYVLEPDVHGQAGITCSDCHGGDPGEASVRAHDLGAGFVGRPAPLAAASLCGRCHDGSTEHAPAVVLEYRAGRHGRTLAEGRLAATCTSCHGAHGIERPRAASDSEDDGAPRELGSGDSRERRRIVAACVACHSAPDVMRASGLPTNQAAQWARSVHGRAVEQGETRAPDCASCHDPHENEAGLAAVRSCGGCHEELRAAFDRGPHAEQFARLGFLDCAECHGDHDVAPATGAMLVGITAVCTRCHGRGQEAFETVRAIASHAASLDRARDALPPDDPRRRAMIDALHALDPDGMAEAIAAAELGEPEEEEERQETVTTGLAWGFGLKASAAALLALAGLFLIRRSRRSS